MGTKYLKNYNMNYFENQELEYLTSFLTEKECGSVILNGKVEAFINQKSWLPEDNQELNNNGKIGNFRPRAFSSGSFSTSKPNRKRSSSLGDLKVQSSRQLFLDLISTMNESFPDYDFETTKLEQFAEKDFFLAMSTVNSYFAELTEIDPQILERLWNAINEVVNLRKCEVFSYTPDDEEDPFSNGCLWSLNYFFFCKDLNTLCFLTCVATSKYCKFSNSSDQFDSDERMDLQSDEEEDSDSIDEDFIPDWEGVI